MEQHGPRTKSRRISAELLRLHQTWCRSNFATNSAFRTLGGRSVAIATLLLGACKPALGERAATAPATTGPSGERSIGPASEAPGETVPTPGAVRCEPTYFWTGSECLLRREVLTASNAASVIVRCERGDDQPCPLALEQLRHECALGVEQRCAQARELLNTWRSRRDESWANARCALGQAAACVLGGAHELQRCERADVTACRSLLGRLAADSVLAEVLDTSRKRLQLRVCEFEPAAHECARESVRGSAEQGTAP